jgi:NAD dependent epimerase/dehydratase family enzyme
VLDGQRAVPSRLLQQGFAFRFRRAAEALVDLLD